MNNYKWRFPASNYGQRKGLSNGDTEAFKKTPYVTFAREILQNSIDARVSDEEPVKVEFSLFKMKTSDIPGINELKDSIRRCKEYWLAKPDYVKEYEKIENELSQNEITCLRVSDYNTTGLIGVESNISKNNHFLALTKGTGVSEKSSALAGGSKGMGKNAVFLMSKIRTVFYSTRTTKNINDEDDECSGYIGVADFISGYINDDYDDGNRDYTQGEGYYSFDDYNSAISGVLKLDPNDCLRDTEAGTDIFILDYRENSKWDEEIINSILDSFMASIVRGHLEVSVNGLDINSKTVETIIGSDIISSSNRSNIISQYRLIKGGEGVLVYDIGTEYGTCELYVIPFNKDEEELATHRCVMIRHPLMKIKEIKIGSNLRVSALCIIPNNSLGKMLREIENPQHVDWEPKRIQDDQSLRKEYENLLRQITTDITSKINEIFLNTDENPLDPLGAGQFLPEDIGGEEISSKENGSRVAEKVYVTKPKEVKTFDSNAKYPDDNGNGLQPDIGAIDDTVSGVVSHPNGHNKNNGEDPHGGDETGDKKPGDNVIMVRSKLSGIKYTFLSTDKSAGKVRISFISPIKHDDCYLNIKMLDDSNSQENIAVLSMMKNGELISSKDAYEYGPFNIFQNEKVILDITTNIVGYFAATIKVICLERRICYANKK